MQTEWNEHTFEVRGDWTFRWLYLAPEYELRIDDQRVDRTGGPVLQPKLEGLFEDREGEVHHVEAQLLSILGYHPDCELSIDDEPVASERVRVQNFLNPFLAIVILVSTAIMLYLGPDVIRAYWPV
jgi:hypothetical protein